MEKVFWENGFITGRMISGSKSLYRKVNPGNFTVFNANVLTEEDGKIWFGDLDLTEDDEILKKIAEKIGKKLYVLREMDCRFENENKPVNELLQKAVWDSENGILEKD